MDLKKNYFLLLLFVLGCSPNQKNEYYFYDNKAILEQDTIGSILSYSINIPTYSYWNDTIKVEVGAKGYFFMHYKKTDTSTFNDTVFVKPESYLDSIQYFNSDWFNNEENLKDFWDLSLYEKGGSHDTLKIFLIEHKKGTDSLIFKRVHRFYMPGREG